MAKKEDRTLSVLAHALTFFGGFIAPLIILLVAKDEMTRKHARNALNWQISLAIYFIISFVLLIIIIGFFLIIALAIINIIFVIIAAVKAGNGELWKYPLAIPFLN
jgi:uncharacterized protein